MSIRAVPQSFKKTHIYLAFLSLISIFASEKVNMIYETNTAACDLADGAVAVLGKG